MLLFLSITGISLFIILLYFNVRKFPSSLYLGFYFFLVSVYCLHNYITFYSKSVFLISLSFIHIGFLSFLTGPMLYWYIRSLLTDHHRLYKSDAWHLLPMLVFLAASLPYFFMPFDFKVQIAGNISQDVNYLGTFRGAGLFQFLSPEVVFLSRPFLILAYTFWSALLVMKAFRNKKASVYLSKQYFMVGWLTVLLGFTFILNAAHFMTILKTFDIKDSGMLYSLNVLQVLSVTGLTGLMISPFFFPRILYGLPRVPEPVTLHASIPELDSPIVPDNKKPALHLADGYLLSVGSKADLCMKQHQPYLQPDFNLPQLSYLINIPVHHLAYFFREYKKQSFNDYRNEWRINHAKNLILEGMANGVTLEAIGRMSGFSNRNSFRIIFEKAEGVSPSEFAAKEFDHLKVYPLG